MNWNEMCIKLLEDVIANIRCGNSDIDEAGMNMITEAIQMATNQKQNMGTDEAIRYIGCSRVAFYDMKEKGVIRGKKGRFQKTIYYTKQELDEAIKLLRNKG